MTNEAIDRYCRYAVREKDLRFLPVHWKCRHPDRNTTWRLPSHPRMNCGICDRCMYDCSTFEGEVCPRREPPARKVKNRLGPDTHTHTHRKGLSKKVLLDFFTKKKGD